MKKSINIAFLFIAVLSIASTGFAQNNNRLRIIFREGDSYHVRVSEVLRLTQQMSQVDSEVVEPATRTSVYNFTETIESVNPDGTAMIGATLDSFTTRIVVGKKLDDRNEFFRFNSNNDYDLQNRLRDIKALPRAQFLGQTIRYQLGNDGLVKRFVNLTAFQEATIARSFEYDMLHAMMSFSDSLRIGQLLEQGFGALAASENGGKIETPFTLTEVHVTRKLKTVQKGDQLTFTSTYGDVPERIEYLEGISFPMNIANFHGMGKGIVKFKEGVVVSGSAFDSAKMDLHLDKDTIKNEAVRQVSFTREPIKVLRGAMVKIKDVEEHHTPPKEKKLDDDTNVRWIEPSVTRDSTVKQAPPKK